MILALFTLAQRFTGYENKVLGYFIGVIAIICFALWVYTFIGEFIKNEFPRWRWGSDDTSGFSFSKLVHAGRARTVITWLVCFVLLFVVAYPWIGQSRVPVSKPSSVPAVNQTPQVPSPPSARSEPLPFGKSSDITWDFTNILTMGRDGPLVEPWIASFQAQGQNNLDEPLLKIGGFVRSDRSNIQRPIRLALSPRQAARRLEEMNGIPRRASFRIESENFEPDQHMPALKFLNEFGGFTFEFEYDGKRFEHHFLDDELMDRIDKFRKESQKMF